MRLLEAKQENTPYFCIGDWGSLGMHRAGLLLLLKSGGFSMCLPEPTLLAALQQPGENSYQWMFLGQQPCSGMDGWQGLVLCGLVERVILLGKHH